MDVIPDAAAWRIFGGVGAVIIFLAMIAGALRGLGALRGRQQPSPSPEAIALIESTQTLVQATEAIAARSESLGRIHKRLDDVERELSTVKAQTARVEGQLTQANRTLTLIQEHLLNRP